MTPSRIRLATLAFATCITGLTIGAYGYLDDQPGVMVMGYMICQMVGLAQLHHAVAQPEH